MVLLILFIRGIIGVTTTFLPLVHLRVVAGARLNHRSVAIFALFIRGINGDTSLSIALLLTGAALNSCMSS